MTFNSPITELIRKRRSIRTYSGKPLPDPALRALGQTCSDLTRGPLGSFCRFALVHLSDSGEKNETLSPALRPGTYGLIRNARSYIVGAIHPGRFEDYGYLMETIVLQATDLGLGTCWLGGTFSRSSFSRIIGLQQDERLPAVSPVGFAAAHRHPAATLVSAVARSTYRKSWERLFYREDFEHPMSSEQSVTMWPESLTTALEMIRLAPSSANRQPWRILMSSPEVVHFFLYRTGIGTGGGAGGWLDIGIAMCHFELSLRAHGIIGSWCNEDPGLTSKNLEYRVSWRGRQN